MLADSICCSLIRLILREGESYMKKAFSALLAAAMAVSAVPVVSVSAETTPTVKFYIEPDVTTANPGDTITYTVSMEATGGDGFSSIFVGFAIPDGLTFVKKGKKAGYGLEMSETVDEWVNSDELEYYWAYDPSALEEREDGTFFTGFFLDDDGNDTPIATPLAKTVLVTFQCTVNDDAATGNYQVTLDPAVANQVGFVDGESSTTLTYGDGNSEEGFAEEPVDPVIIDNEPATVDPESVTVDPTTKTLTKHGETFTIDATVLPEETTDKTVLFQSDNSNVALVDSNGTVTAGIDGVANIIARASKQGVQATTVVTVAIEHTADDLAYVPGDPADCQHDGTQGYWICSYCGKMFADENGQEEISEPLVDPQTDHTPGEPVEENIVPPTCTEQGHFDQVVYCEVCGEELSREVMYTGYAEHDLEYVEAEPATCTTPGHEACYKCSVCNKLFADAEGETEIDAAATTRPLGHDDTGDWVRDESTLVEPTCGASGSVDEVLYCKRDGCGEEIGRRTVTLDPTGVHDYTTFFAVEPTCTEDGHAFYKKCSVCGKMIDANDNELQAVPVIEKLGHDDTGDYVRDESTLVPPTCKDDGSVDMVLYCKRDGCGAELDRKTVTLYKTNDHDLETVEGKDPTCGEAGYYSYQKCTVCGALFDMDGDPIDAIPTIPATGLHTFEDIEAHEATCTEAGNLAYKHCTVCGKVFEPDGETETTMEAVTLTALGHDWSEWETVTEPTETEPGWKRRECSRCDAYEEEEIPATGGDSSSDESSDVDSDSSDDSTESTESTESTDSTESSDTSADSSKDSAGDSSKADTSSKTAAATSTAATTAANTATNPATGAATGTAMASIALIAAFAVIKKKHK